MAANPVAEQDKEIIVSVDCGTLATKISATYIESNEHLQLTFPSIGLPLIARADITRAKPIELVQFHERNHADDQWWTFGDTLYTHGERSRPLHTISQSRYTSQAYRRLVLYSLWRVAQEMSGKFKTVLIPLPGAEYTNSQRTILDNLSGKYKIVGQRETKPLSITLSEDNVKFLPEGAPTGFGLNTYSAASMPTLFEVGPDGKNYPLPYKPHQMNYAVLSMGYYTATLVGFTNGRLIERVESNPEVGANQLFSAFLNTAELLNPFKALEAERQIRAKRLVRLGYEEDISARFSAEADRLLGDILNWAAIIIERLSFSPSLLVLTGGTAELIGYDLSEERLNRIVENRKRLPQAIIKMTNAPVADAVGGATFLKAVYYARKQKTETK